MMQVRAYQLTKALKAYDRLLYAEVVSVRRKRSDLPKGFEGDPYETLDQIHVKRISHNYEMYDWFDDIRLFASKTYGELLFALTEDWSTKTDPIDWGVLPILAKLREMDRWNRGGEDLFREMDKINEKEDASIERQRKNVLEDGLREMHSAFRKSTDDVNTSQLKDPRLKTLKTRSY